MHDSELKDFFQEHANYYRNCDVHGMISQYHDRSRFWEACGSSLNGIDEIHGWFNIMFSQWDVGGVEHELIDQRIEENLAVCACLWTVLCCEKGADKGMRSVLVRSTYCLIKVDGIWKIWHVHSGV